ncbi:MAG: DUF6128 domain-containing protein [Lachnospiraceae bacterium]|nr:DUF6128 domain-containing protein [Lachnospiraceae bacterium]
MANYKRRVTYFYHYNNDKIGNTAGFSKLEIRGEDVRITINIQENINNRTDPVLCFYYEEGNNLNVVKIETIRREKGVITFCEKSSRNNFFDTGKELYNFDGVIVLYSENDYYLGDFEDRDRRTYSLNLEDKPKAKTEDEEIVPVNEPTQKVDEHDQQDKKKELIDKTDLEYGFERVVKTSPKLPMFNAEELFDCVRIHPRDIGRLDIGNWKLGTNSFLTHGYYTYQYLMLGRMRFPDGRKHAVLGVPGLYTSREKYLANMFGFEQFVPVKKTGKESGQFGYWIVEINEGNVNSYR